MRNSSKLLLCLPLLSLSQVYGVDDFAWNTPGPADWNNAANWNPINIGVGNNDRFVNNGGTATITANTTLIIRDTKIGVGAGTSGTVNHSAGLHANGAGNWSFIGEGAGSNGAYNVADTSIGGGTYTGFGMGSGSHTAGDIRIAGGGGSQGILRMNTSGTVTAGGGLLVGLGGIGRLDIDNGTLTANGETWFGNGAGGSGAVRQSGGTVSSGNWLAIGRDSGVGTYELAGGTLQHTGVNHSVIGSINGTGTLTQTGPASIFNAVNDLRLGEGAVGRGTYNISAGRANINGWTIVGWTGGGTGVLNVSGSGYYNSQYVEVGGGAGGAGNGVVNLDGGTIETKVIARNGGAVSGQVNFNGGILKAKESNANILPGFTPATSEILAGGLKLDTNGFNTAIVTGLDGVGGLTKQGLGRLTLNGISTYAGQTIVSAGTLTLAAGSALNGGGGVLVEPGATLDGNGSATGPVTVNGTIAPGTSIGTLTFGGPVNLNGTTLMEIDRTGAPAADLIIAAGTIDYGGDLDVILLGGTPQLGDTFNLFDAPSFFDVFATIDLPALSVGLTWQNNLSTDGSISVVPEASSFTLAGLAALGLLGRRRRRA